MTVMISCLTAITLYDHIEWHGKKWQVLHFIIWMAWKLHEKKRNKSVTLHDISRHKNNMKRKESVPLHNHNSDIITYKFDAFPDCNGMKMD